MIHSMCLCFSFFLRQFWFVSKTCLTLLWWLIFGTMLFPLAGFIFFSVWFYLFIYALLVSLMFKGSTQCFMMLHNFCDLICGSSNRSIKHYFCPAHNKTYNLFKPQGKTISNGSYERHFSCCRIAQFKLLKTTALPFMLYQKHPCNHTVKN